MDKNTASDVGRMEGRYANHVKVGYNAFEFVLDFIQHYPENGENKVCSRIITSPVYAKAFFETLRESIERYEHDNGLIEGMPE